MDFEDYPLLNPPDLMVRLLRAGRDGEAGFSRVLADIHDRFRRIGKPVPVGDDELCERLGEARLLLERAGLIEIVDGERHRPTARGLAVLAEHPDGIDDTVLMRFPEFRDFVRARFRVAEPDDPHAEVVDQGYAAHRDGRRPTENPYPSDTVEHLAWAQGWWQARDDALG